MGSNASAGKHQVVSKSTTAPHCHTIGRPEIQMTGPDMVAGGMKEEGWKLIRPRRGPESLSPKRSDVWEGCTTPLGTPGPVSRLYPHPGHRGGSRLLSRTPPCSRPSSCQYVRPRFIEVVVPRRLPVTTCFAAGLPRHQSPCAIQGEAGATLCNTHSNPPGSAPRGVVRGRGPHRPPPLKCGIANFPACKA